MKSLIITGIAFIAILLVSKGYTQETGIFLSDKLEKKWETARELQVPESVCYDEANQVLYVANIGGKPTDKDMDGFISKVGLDGTIAELKWVTGLNAPKGMGIYKNLLYVTDIDRVAEIDIESMMIVRFYQFPEAKFLNDITIDQKGAVYISDMMSTRIYRIYDLKADTWLDDEALTSPNGLFIDDKDLLIGCQRIVRSSLRNKDIKDWVTNTGSIDGLKGTGDGRYLFSDWQGNVYLVGTDQKIEKILGTAEAGINAADIEYIPSLKLLLVPTFFDNRVMAYELK